MNIVMMGPQGSGKGTQAKLLAERQGFEHVETGKMLRKLAEEDEAVYELIFVKGELYPDEEMITMVEKELGRRGELAADKVFDGYPRTLNQYTLLKKWLLRLGQKLDLVLLIDIGEAETVRRLSARRTCEKCGKVYNLMTNPPEGESCVCGGKLVQRKDDTPAVIRKRLDLYQQETLPVVEKARGEGLLVEIDGERPIEEIYLEVEEEVKKYGS